MSYVRTDFQLHLSGSLLAERLGLAPGQRVGGGKYDPARDCLELVIFDQDPDRGLLVGECNQSPVRWDL